MNNLNKDIAEAIGEISKVATLINMQGKHHVFIRMSGHVKNIEIAFHKNGWKENGDPTMLQQLYFKTNDEDTDEEKLEFQKDALKVLRKVKDTLYKFLKNGQVTMKNRGYDIEEVKHYKFY
jgi:hypothetical protein